ncbi:hypothetical protein ASPFODRAFT_272074 [Aspergillus luchuensis CBS 106.47]|uniref:Uncharacterized protein n=1 Tax=Aspergillus luchuensis (strain CBS 106.47) TaxID=1137211 RepID=A0A1M3U0Y2_ASPLC|nr:hypothetical protein ASPFODRAFT_272074 [Aspergillus luchuensis CBS 106.47]
MGGAVARVRSGRTNKVRQRRVQQLRRTQVSNRNNNGTGKRVAQVLRELVRVGKSTRGAVRAMSGSEETEGCQGESSLRKCRQLQAGRCHSTEKLSPQRVSQKLGQFGVEAAGGEIWKVKSGLVLTLSLQRNTGALLWVNPAESLAEQHNGRTSQANWGGL